MKLDPKRPFHNFLLRVAALLSVSIVALLGSSYRLRIVEGEGVLRQLREKKRPVLLTFWHEGAIVFAQFFWRSMNSKGYPVTVLASASRDGELTAHAARLAGFSVVRGSASRGGRQAIRELYREIVKRGRSPVTIPDGPHGPLHKFKPGFLTLAKLSQAPILPLSFAVDRTWRLKSWDRMYVPRPFARISLVVGEPVSIPKDADEDELEVMRYRLEEVLNELGRRVRSPRFSGQETG